MATAISFFPTFVSLKTKVGEEIRDIVVQNGVGW